MTDKVVSLSEDPNFVAMVEAGLRPGNTDWNPKEISATLNLLRSLGYSQPEISDAIMGLSSKDSK